MGADAGEGAIGGSLDQLDGGIFFAQPSGYLVDVLDFQTKMLQPGLPSQFLGDDVHTDITVTDGNGALRPWRFGRFHSEQSFVKPAEQHVVVADDGEVLDLCEHFSSSFLRRFVINLGDEPALFQLGENTVVDEIIGVQLGGLRNFLAHLIEGEFYRAPIAVGN